MEDWSKEKDEIDRLMHELEEEEITELSELIREADDLIRKFRSNKSQIEKLRLGKADLEDQLRKKIEGKVSYYQKLLEKKETVENRIGILTDEKKKLEGLDLIYGEHERKTSRNDETTRAKTDFKTKLSGIEDEIKELKELLEKMNGVIATFGKHISSFSDLPVELCRRLDHPRKIKKQVSEKRGEMRDRWYCPNCKEFIDE